VGRRFARLTSHLSKNVAESPELQSLLANIEGVFARNKNQVLPAVFAVSNVGVDRIPSPNRSSLRPA
jgi:hypothetical protein